MGRARRRLAGCAASAATGRAELLVRGQPPTAAEAERIVRHDATIASHPPDLRPRGRSPGSR